MIISCGRNIYPRGVEEALLTTQDAAEVLVIGRAHPDWEGKRRWPFWLHKLEARF
ncbi:MAG: hypothetical protein P8I83_05175 [Paracoccaceae bacterium]|nr:hypothetical protein [Paracoccaceae bacterium]